MNCWREKPEKGEKRMTNAGRGMRIGGWLAAVQVVGLAGLVAWAGTLRAAEDDLFRDTIAPLFERRCVSCHNETERKGGLSLSTAADLAKGGESGAVVKAGRAADSSLWTMIHGEKPEMPKSGRPLTAAQEQAVARWIDAGAKWPAGLTLEEKPAADTNWWSLQPLVRRTPSAISPPNTPPNTPPGTTANALSGDGPVLRAEDRIWSHGLVDDFIATKRRAQQLRGAAEAERATLARRLGFDLHGLPLDPEVIADFIADDDPSAYERLVDRLLASPRLGERWARHWLDVVHYGDTHGYDKDKLRPNAWPYRDYVIRAFNADTPYERFVREQLAGDAYYPDTTDGITALGFISAGPWDFISHAEVPETKLDGKIARNLDRDDMVVNTLNTFCSTTVQCARCHDHKFDPIAMTDYYRLQAVFAALDRADRSYDVDAQVSQHRQQLRERLQRLGGERQQLEMETAKLGGEPLAALQRRIADLTKAASTNPALHAEYGYHSQIEPAADRPKWVQVDLGESRSIHKIVLHPCWDDFNGIGAGFGFPVRYKLEIADDADFKTNVVVVADRTRENVANPGTVPQEVAVTGKTGRFVRLTATRLATRSNDYILAVAELRVLDEAGLNHALNRPVTALDSIEGAPRWRRTNLVDDRYPVATNKAAAEQLADATRARDELLQRVVPLELRERRQKLEQEIAELEAAQRRLPPQQLVYAGTVHFGSGAFLGTGPTGGKPRPIHVLARGDVRKPVRAVGPGTLAVVPDLAAEFSVPDDAPESARRVALAEWITSKQNPLTWRSIVNRVWQYHFGRGLVESASDFGRMGMTPSHPELLDTLAADFRDGSQSLKQLHRQLVTSATYRQSTAHDEANFKVDSGNVYLWRMNRRKLEAEAIRDSVLWVAGRLNLAMGGPGFQDFVIERPEHSPHYEYRLHDPSDPRSQRRAVYRFLVRSQPQPFMTTLDCADPSIAVDRRNETINALQALALMNNKLTVLMAQHFAERLMQMSPQVEQQLELGFRLALGRAPTRDELQSLTEYTERFGLANACRVILNLNEFAFVD
ncbi:MAG: DUF1553 domain-containing protein [Planctomycetota bacterium]